MAAPCTLQRPTGMNAYTSLGRLKQVCFTVRTNNQFAGSLKFSRHRSLHRSLNSTLHSFQNVHKIYGAANLPRVQQGVAYSAPREIETQCLRPPR